MRTLLPLVLLAACSGPSPTPAPPATPAADGTVTVVMSSRVEAELEPCG